MQNSIPPSKHSEIDLNEFFFTLWSHKIFITFVCTISILIGAQYVTKLENKYSASSIFKLDNSSSDLPISGNTAALAALAGVGDFGSNSTTPVDEIMGREFIEYIDKELDLRNDSFFNDFDPTYVDPAWKIVIKKFIGAQNNKINMEETVWQKVAHRYSKNVLVEETKNGSTEIIVTHKSAKRAAEIANGIMTTIIKISKDRNYLSQDAKLEYLAKTLTKSLNDLEFAQTQIKNFTLEKNLLPLENFSSDTSRLDLLREQLARTIKLYEALDKMKSLIKSNSTSTEDYLSLRKKFPIVDQVEFRRVLGQNEIISSWSWPDLNSVVTVFNTIADRKKRLEFDVDSAKLKADRSGKDLEIFAQFERKAKVAQATYTVLIEQVKAQSILLDFALIIQRYMSMHLLH